MVHCFQRAGTIEACHAKTRQMSQALKNRLPVLLDRTAEAPGTCISDDRGRHARRP